jgi:excisionase family DNA binding protein
MSSNIEIERICQHCNKDFIAKTTVTRYCSDDCAKRAYKARKRAEKIGVSVAEIQQIRQKPIEDLKAREFLTVKNVADLLNCSVRSVYCYIENGKINATNIGQRLIRVKRSEIDKLFEPKEKIKPIQVRPLDIAEYYTISEVQEKFKVSQSALQKIMKRNNVQKMQKGKFVYVPKEVINNIFK